VSHLRGLDSSFRAVLPVQLRPSEHEPQLAPAEAAFDDLESVNPYFRRSVGMSGVKVRRAVIIEVHRDHDPEEAADRRHEEIFSRVAADNQRESS
jgi:hypothetical protein